MGACCGKLCCGVSLDDNTKMINSKLRSEERDERGDIKLLFLGPGGSGKSTIFKQLQYCHGKGFGRTDSELLVDHIHFQTVYQMQECIEHYLSSTEHDFLSVAGSQSDDDSKVAGTSDTTTTDTNGTPTPRTDAGTPTPNQTLTQIVNDEKLQSYIDTVKEYRTPNELSPAIAEAIKYIWQNDPRLKDIFIKDHRKKVLDETTEFFWNDIDRISSPDYLPTKQDIINVRYRTTGMIDKRFAIKDRKYHIFDVGGQKSERKKWFRYVDDVRAVVFVVSLACYNEVMYEDQNKNCMMDALALFSETVNSKQFRNAPFILFLNKRDLFREKVQRLPITTCPAFEDFYDTKTDPNDYDQCVEYITDKFRSKRKSAVDDIGRNREMYFHVTCAMDDENIKNVFDDVTRLIVNQIMGNMAHMV